MTPLSQIRRDGGTQTRTAIDPAAVSDYADRYREGLEMPPVVVFDDGSSLWLADGFHRVAGAELAGRGEIPTEVRSGTVLDARRYALGANQDHGVRLTNADKRNKVRMALGDSEWSALSDREIGRRCGVDHKTVAAVRREITEPVVVTFDRLDLLNGDPLALPFTPADIERCVRRCLEVRPECTDQEIADHVGRGATTEMVAAVRAGRPIRSVVTEDDDFADLLALWTDLYGLILREQRRSPEPYPEMFTWYWSPALRAVVRRWLGFIRERRVSAIAVHHVLVQFLEDRDVLVDLMLSDVAAGRVLSSRSPDDRIAEEMTRREDEILPPAQTGATP